MDKKIIAMIPKIELHCHLSGSIRPETIFDIALKEQMDVTAQNFEKFKSLVQVSEGCKSLKEYLMKFDLTLSVMQKPEYLYRITLEMLEDLSKDNVKYAEIRFSPYLHMKGGMSFNETIESILRAMEDGKSEYGIRSKLILICMRNHRPKISIDTVRKGAKFLGKGVVAIDMAGNEQDYPPEIHREAFKLARECGFHITVHAGETGIPKNIITAVKELYAERIGHGVHAYMDRDALKLVKDNNIPLEMCLSSNVQTAAIESYEAHPIKKYLEQGLKVTVNTDNLTVSNTTLGDEYEKLIEFQGFDSRDFIKVLYNGVDASFTSDNEKTELKEIFNAELNLLGLL